ncbi:hypothetical protein L916_09285, partial [Phytophthora nicotianae]
VAMSHNEDYRRDRYVSRQYAYNRDGSDSHWYDSTRGRYGSDGYNDCSRSDSHGYGYHRDYDVSSQYGGGASRYSDSPGEHDQGHSGYDRGYGDYGEGYNDRFGSHGGYASWGNQGGHGKGRDRERHDRSYGGDRGGGHGRDDRGYGRQRDYGSNDRPGEEDRGYDGGHRNRDGRGERGRRGGRGGSGSQEGPGAGFISGSGYELIGNPISDPRVEEEWSGRAGAHEVRSDDPDLQREVQICHRPGVASGGRTIPVNVNYFKVSVDKAPKEIFKYHVTVERSRDVAAASRYGTTGAQQITEDPGGEAANAAPRHEPRPERPLPRALIGTVINATLLQYKESFEGVRVVHDAMASLYAPVKLSWTLKEFVDVDPDNTDAARDYRQQMASSHSENTKACVNNFRTYLVKMKMVEVISLATLNNYYSDASVNVMPVVQALNVVARHLATQRFVTVGSELYNMKDKKLRLLSGGKEIYGGYHQALHVADHKVVMNINQTIGVFYSPGPLMDLVMAALRVRNVNDIKNLSEKQLKGLARALRKIDVFPTHRSDRRRPICGVSVMGADITMMNYKGEVKSVANYFSDRYQKTLQYPSLPMVNVGSKRPGKETWLPIEVCTVAPGQHFSSSDNVDQPEVIRLASQPPRARQADILNHVHQAGFENDPYLEAFGLNVEQRFQTVEARVMDGPYVQYENVSVHRSDGQWSLNNKKLVCGMSIRNWGVVVLGETRKSEVNKFKDKLCEAGDERGMPFKNKHPVVILQRDNRDMEVDELMELCLRELLEKNEEGSPQLILVILPETNSVHYGEVKRMSDTVLGIASQCVVAEKLRKANAAFCANVCLKINMRLGGKNAVLKGPLPLISAAPTIVIGVDVERSSYGMDDQPAIAAVVASMDAYSAQYAARVAAQNPRKSIEKLPKMLKELFLVYCKNTERRPEHVLYYRDGVSDGEMQSVLQTEMRALCTAFKMISGDYKPLVTFIVANKRHHVRAFPVNSRDGDSKGNVKPGTVIDSVVMDPHLFSFYLWGHSTLQGTSRPCHYTVLYDDNSLAAEDVQLLTYHLGYTFARSTHSVSVITPVYYANEAAAHARHFLEERMAGTDTTVSGGGRFKFANVHKEVLNRMFFI